MLGHRSKISLRWITDKGFIASVSSLCKRVVFLAFYSLKCSVSPLLVFFITEAVRNKIKWFSDSFGFNCFFVLFL